MCDLLAISAAFNYAPWQYLPLFAEKGNANVSGWGLGFFRDTGVVVEASTESVYQDNRMHDSFQRLARVIDSRMILAHLSCPLSGGRHEREAHPFTLDFLGHSWLFVHVGIVETIGGYRTRLQPRLDVHVASARVFEFLRDRMCEIVDQEPYCELLDALTRATTDLVQAYPGHYSYFLANESVLFGFFNFRQLTMLKLKEPMGDVLLITTIEEGLSSEPWRFIGLEGDSLGKIVVVGGADFLYQRALHQP